MLPAELAELEIAEIKSQDQFTAALTVVENEPADIAGQEGFRIRLRYKNNRGLEIQRVVYAARRQVRVLPDELRAPTLYYFDTYYPDFQKAVASFQLRGAGNKKTTGALTRQVVAQSPKNRWKRLTSHDETCPPCRRGCGPDVGRIELGPRSSTSRPCRTVASSMAPEPMPGAKRVETMKPKTDTTGVRPVGPKDEKALQQREMQREQQATRQNEIQQAEQALRDAEAAQAAGKEPLPGERQGTAGGASRLTDEYWERQKALAAAVADARKRVEEVRGCAR